MGDLAIRLRGRDVPVSASRHMTVTRAASVGVPRKSMAGRAMNVTVAGVRVSARVAGVTAHTAQDREERRRQASAKEAGDEHCVHVR